MSEVAVTTVSPDRPKVQAVLERFVKEHKLPLAYIELAQKWFINLALSLIEHQISAGKPIIVGINGCQGSGKSTLSLLMVDVLTEVYEVDSITFSIDDFYLTKQARETLSKSIHPLFKTRGVPGTHDIPLLESVLADLVGQKNTRIPVFDKSIDDALPIEHWVDVTHCPQIIILEGWCVGIDGQTASQLAQPVNALERLEDTSGAWRQYVNDTLMIDYKRIFSSIDYLVMLQAPSFEHVFQWRCEQEHKLKASLDIKPAKSDKSNYNETMSDEEIYRFIQFYERLTQHALLTLPAKCDRVFTLDEQREITQCQ